MAWEQAIQGADISLEGSADNSSYQYHFCGMPDTSDQVTIAGAGEHILGVIQNVPGAAAGRENVVRIAGISKLVTDGSSTAIVRGDRLKADASGHGVKGETDNNEIGAIALGASTASGTIISVLVIPAVRY
jgi:hypothetical protein